jgi:hypothetical protein
MSSVGGLRRKGAGVSMMDIQHPESERMFASSSETPFWKIAIVGIIVIAAIILGAWLITSSMT